MMYKEVFKWLQFQSISVEKNWLRLRLESHPDYPSLTAVQDTLEELGVYSYACTGTKEELKQENKPFLAHFNINGGHVLYFNSVTEAEKRYKDFDRYWTGRVMFAEKTAIAGDSGHAKQITINKQNRVFAFNAILFVIVSLVGLPIYYGNNIALLMVVTNLCGLYFSWLIAQKEFGISNSISDKICSMAKNSRCEAVLNSKGAKLFGLLSWGDVGLVYFTTILLIITANTITGTPLFFINYISIAALAFPLYSLYYQWQVVKQWCMLCIGVLAVLILNAIIAITQIHFFIEKEIIKSALVFIVMSIGLLSLWQLLKHIYKQSLQVLEQQITATRLKRSPKIFTALLDKQELRNENLPRSAEPLCFGSPTATYQLVIACNPYCGPCAKAHHAIEELYEKYPGKLNVSIRFALGSTDTGDNRTAAASEILKAAVYKPFEAVRDWYRNMDLEKFKELHHTNGEEVSGAIAQHIQWTETAQINATPTVFVNGRKLPELYSWTELVAALDYELK